jgi:tight adherence protein C
MDDMLALVNDWAADPAVLLGLMALTALAFMAVAASNWMQSRQSIRRRAQEGFERVSADPASTAGQSLERLMRYMETTFAGYDQKQMAVLRLRLVQAGFFDQRAPVIFFAARFACGIAIGLGGLAGLSSVVVGPANLAMYALGLGAAGYFLPSFYVSRRIAARIDAHRAGFPDFMDLMVVCAEAGLSMEAALDRVAREMVDGHPSLAENLYMVSLEMRAGKPFGEALERLGHRLGIDEATSLASLLQQSAELGTSLVTSLRIYSDDMRHKRLSRAEEKAYSLPAKLVIPLMIFVFPVLLASLIVPVAIRVANIM